MNTQYQKLYAYLVGQVDDALQYVAGELSEGDCGRDALHFVGEKLKNALLTAEDMYLEATEDKF